MIVYVYIYNARRLLPTQYPECVGHTIISSIIKIDRSGVCVTANLRNQVFPGIPNPLRESGESLKCIEIPQNL